MSDKVLMKGNEAIGEAAIGAVCYFLFNKTGLSRYCYKDGEKPEA